jgi:hypothetical protein
VLVLRVVLQVCQLQSSVKTAAGVTKRDLVVLLVLCILMLRHVQCRHPAVVLDC